MDASSWSAAASPATPSARRCASATPRARDHARLRGAAPARTTASGSRRSSSPATSAETLRLRPPEWYEDHARRAAARSPGHRGRARTSGSSRSTTAPSFRTTALVLATGSNALMPPIPGIDLDQRAPVPRARGLRGDPHGRRGRRARAAVIGGGLLGLEAARGIAAPGLPRHRRAPHRSPDGAPARRGRRGAAAPRSRARRRRAARAPDRGDLGTGRDGRASPAATSSRPTSSSCRSGSRPRRSCARRGRRGASAGSSSTTRMRTSAARRARRRRVRRAPRHRLRPGGADPRAGPRRGRDDSPTGGGARTRARSRARSSRSPGSTSSAIGAPDGDAEAVAPTPPPASTASSWSATARAVGAILLGDVRGAEALLAPCAAASRSTDPLGALAAPPRPGPADLPDAAQICNCNGVCKGDIIARRGRGGRATPREVMAMTRAGTGCGSCKPTVIDLVALAAGGELADEPAYLCPCRARRARSSRTRSAAAAWSRSATSPRRAGRAATAAPASRRSPTSSPRSTPTATARSATPASSTTASTRTSRRTARSASSRACTAASPPRTSCAASPTSPSSYEVPLVKVTGGQRLDLLGVPSRTCRGSGRELGMPSGHAYAKAVRTVKTCVGTDFCRFGLGDAIGLGDRDGEGVGGRSTRRIRSSRACRAARATAPRRRSRTSAWSRSGRPLAGPHRRRRRRQRPRGRHPVHGRHARGGPPRRDHVPAVLPRERGLQGAHVRLRAARRPGDDPRASCSTEEEGAALRERFRIAKAATQDPWLERDDPYHPRQFTDLDDEAREPLALVGPPAGGAADDPRLHASTTSRSARAAASRSPAAGSRCSARRRAGMRSTTRARTRPARSPTGSSATARSSARCTSAASTSTPARRSATTAQASRRTASRYAATTCSSRWAGRSPSRPR